MRDNDGRKLDHKTPHARRVMAPGGLVLNRRALVSHELSSFDHIIRQVEARLNAFLQVRFQQRDIEVDDEDSPPRHGWLYQAHLMMLMTTLVAIALAEVWWVVYLGLPDKRYG